MWSMSKWNSGSWVFRSNSILGVLDFSRLRCWRIRETSLGRL